MPIEQNKLKYNPSQIEQKWEQKWRESKAYFVKEDYSKEKYYCLDFFPYPSGASLSVGHCRNYVPTDVISRFKRMKGYNVLHPMGWDAFGLPAENYAIKQGKHPKATTAENIANFKEQLSILGLSYDWEREINSTDPAFYKWTQWYFLLLYKEGLAYQKVADQWWCPECKTVLANEQVEDGKCWRCASEVTKKGLKQWFFRITSYADRLLNDIEEIDWPNKIKVMQKNWIGRKEGINISYKVEGIGEEITCFTTRPDTNFGATFIVLAPENPIVSKIVINENKEAVEAYIAKAKKKSDIDRISEGREKTGVFTGRHAINNLNGKKIPIYVSDFVLMTVGTGAVVGVPGHDLRDFEFATKYNLPIIRVVVGSDGDDAEIISSDQVQEDEGVMINSEFLNGLDIHEATEKMMDYLVNRGWGERVVTYKMRDWLISRQRYWGAPIPIIHCEKCGGVPVPEKDLPVLLPEIKDFTPTGTGESPLAKNKDFLNTTCPQCGGKATRETDTQDGFACSSWYFLRYTDPNNSNNPFSQDKVSYWCPTDLYVGGAEHAVMHLLYARFFTKVMYDKELVGFNEPFTKLMNQGMILASDGRKMSKSLGNVITPNSVIKKFGADALRAYEMFIGPFEQEVVWDESGIKGTRKFLEKVWDFVSIDRYQSENSEKDILVTKLLHKTIKKVEDDLNRFKFNTVISSLMEFVNELVFSRGSISIGLYTEIQKTLLLIIAPIAPYMSEELWQKVKGSNDPDSIHKASWPLFDEALVQEDEVEIPIQINGKIRDRVIVKYDISKEDIKTIALGRDKVATMIKGKEIRKIIFVKNKMLNFVVM